MDSIFMLAPLTRFHAAKPKIQSHWSLVVYEVIGSHSGRQAVSGGMGKLVVYVNNIINILSLPKRNLNFSAWIEKNQQFA